jgi:GNAT superfamily N-acetyltransferase
MEILDLKQLPRSLHSQLGAIGMLNGDPPQDFAFIRRLRSMGFPAVDYYAVYAVEDREIQSRVEVLQLPFTTQAGAQTVTGISDVSTRPDRVRRGFAGALLREVHRREAARGRRWSLLWTHRSWGAHRLYEALGYRDIYSPPSALRSVGRSGPRRVPKGYGWDRANRRDVVRMERLFDRSTAGRVGMVPRPPRALSIRCRLGWRIPENHRILTAGTETVGYAHLVAGPGSVSVNEVLVAAPEHASAMLDGLERAAQGRWLTFATTTFVTDHAALLRKRGYAVYPTAHLTLMAKPLMPGRPSSDNPATACRDPQFSCHRTDVF